MLPINPIRSNETGKLTAAVTPVFETRPLFGMTGPFPEWDILPPATIPNIRIKKPK